MPQYQLRVYTLRNSDALSAYEKIWAQHIPGMAKHREFRADMEGFDISQIVGLDETLLTPTVDSPLR
ncbi:hypothetical protein ABZ923_10070 [Streptomyces sp. NPDC046881]|uniref:hypothetical protein n=1 Tax=Streptomyces sp. NPDC046881 TaxID=3155374 RepID=UPI0033EB6F47